MGERIDPPISRRVFLKRLGVLGGGIIAKKINPLIFDEQPSSTPSPVVFTGFEPYIPGQDWNTSTMLVQLLKEHYKAEPQPPFHEDFLVNLPVDVEDPEKAARQIQSYVKEQYPKGCIVISFGQALLASSVARVEHQSRKPSPASTLADQPPIWQLSDRIYILLRDTVQKHRAEIFSDDPAMDAEFLFQQNKVGEHICGRTLAAMYEFSYIQARAKTPYPILPIFIHVPLLVKKIHPATWKIAHAVADVAGAYFRQNYRHPEQFVTKLEIPF